MFSSIETMKAKRLSNPSGLPAMEARINDSVWIHRTRKYREWITRTEYPSASADAFSMYNRRTVTLSLSPTNRQSVVNFLWAARRFNPELCVNVVDNRNANFIIAEAKFAVGEGYYEAHTGVDGALRHTRARSRGGRQSATHIPYSGDKVLPASESPLPARYPAAVLNATPPLKSLIMEKLRQTFEAIFFQRVVTFTAYRSNFWSGKSHDRLIR